MTPVALLDLIGTTIEGVAVDKRSPGDALSLVESFGENNQGRRRRFVLAVTSGPDKVRTRSCNDWTLGVEVRVIYADKSEDHRAAAADGKLIDLAVRDIDNAADVVQAIPEQSFNDPDNAGTFTHVRPYLFEYTDAG